MAKLDTFEVRVETGERGREDTPKFSINGFSLDFDEVDGGVGPGETLEAKGAPGSFPHSLTLGGPKEGFWDIESITATFYPADEEPYKIRFGAVTLDAE